MDRYHRRHRSAQLGEPFYMPSQPDARSEGDRDADRILYSPYLQRLGDVTQILSPGLTPFVIHNRQHHAWKAAQIARALATRLLQAEGGHELAFRAGGIDPAIAYCGGLGHDLGHPPFGHVGEVALNNWAQEWGLEGFQGNAQSLRIVTKLASQPGVPFGLNLTRGARNAMTKYPWMKGADLTKSLAGSSATSRIDSAKYWAFFSSESMEMADAALAKRSELASEPTAEARIVDFADDITYALHDVEDFWRLNLVSLGVLQRTTPEPIRRDVIDSLRKKNPTLFDATAWSDAISAFARYLNKDSIKPLLEPYESRRDQESAIREFTSYWLTKWIDSAVFRQSTYGVFIEVESTAWHEVNVLKQLTWDRVITRPSLGVMQTGQREVIDRACSAMSDMMRSWISEPGGTRPPTSLVQAAEVVRMEHGASHIGDLTEAMIGRSTLDYLSALTERQMYRLAGAVDGSHHAEAMEAWIW